MTYRAVVLGPPQFVGNKRGFVNPRTGAVILTEQKGAQVRSWQDNLRAAMQEYAPPQPLNQPVRVNIEIAFARPAGHYGSGRNADRVKDKAPWFHSTKPDSDKIARAVLDCLTGTWLVDDARVSELAVSKTYVLSDGVACTVVTMEALR